MGKCNAWFRLFEEFNSRVPFHQADKFRINLITACTSPSLQHFDGRGIQNGQDFDFIKMASVTPPIIGVFDKCPFTPGSKLCRT
ncbi:MAG: hypothetical protein Ct9H90mP8_3310 [Pseudomonadota bacterium]|nr:MAG: hypothetical protein Ct9H90mP8_3310 [Pseudomonadota bacterium]